MIQRLHLEEAQQPSAYAISAARESGEYRDDKENESLAAEFQSLLAQISGQIAAIPDQAMAVGLALAQTAAPQQQKRDREAEFDNDFGEQQDLLSQNDTQTRNCSVDNSQRDFELRSGEGESNADKTDDKRDDGQGKESEALVEDTSQVVSTQDQVVEVVEQTLVRDITQTIDVNEDTSEDVQLVTQGPQEDHAEQQDVTVASTWEDEQVQKVEVQGDEQIHVDLKQNRVAVKSEKEEDSSEDEELAQTIASVTETSERNAEISSKSLKNQKIDGKYKELSEQSHGALKSDQAAGNSDSSGRNQSQRHAFDERREQQDLDVGSRAQRLSDGVGKGAKVAKEDQSGEFVETLGTPVTRSTDRSSDSNSFQMTILRQSFDALKMNRGEDRAARPQSSGVTATSQATETKSTQNEQSSRSSKTLTRPQTAKMLERVEATLKEAARSRDGRTISLHLEPVNLGKVKVDVSLREGVLHARIAPENQQVMTALREHAHELQSSLRKLGLDVESVSVSVTSESFEGEMNTGQQMSDGRSFQDERNKMPRERAQLAENTVGNELAQHTSAGAETRGSATRNELDHWVA